MSLLDREDLAGRLFFPRPDPRGIPADADDDSVEVEGASLHLRMHGRRLGPRARVVLLFHGNGEIVSDWDPAAPPFTKLGWRFAVLDYRGYGRSTGVPTMRRLLEDAHAALAHVRARGAGPVVVMGRSLGSAAAWEVAGSARDQGAGVDGVIVDSGFTDLDAFARRRGVEPSTLSEDERTVLDPLPRLARVRAPALLLHGERDQVIAHAEAERALEALRADRARLVTLAGRGHDDVSLDPDYWPAVRTFLSRW